MCRKTLPDSRIVRVLQEHKAYFNFVYTYSSMLTNNFPVIS